MTKEQRNILAAELSRAIGRLTELEPGTEDYNRCIEAVRSLIYLNYSVGKLTSGTAEQTPSEQTEEPAVPEEEPNTEEPASAPQPEPTPAPEPKPRLLTLAPKATSALTRDDMITKLSYYRDLGVNVPEIMQSLGYDRLGAIPAGDYEKVLNAVMAAAEGKEAVDAP